MSETQENVSVAPAEPEEQVSVPVETTSSHAEASPSSVAEVELNNQVQIITDGLSKACAELVESSSNTYSRTVAAAPINRNVSEDENFDNLQKAVNILSRAKTLDDNKNFVEALKMYRDGVDILLEELIVRQGTDQSRTYLRTKCNDFMNRIDQLKLIIQIEKAEAAAEKKELSQKQIAQ
jgi:hypothetical protein